MTNPLRDGIIWRAATTGSNIMETFRVKPSSEPITERCWPRGWRNRKEPPDDDT